MTNSVNTKVEASTPVGHRSYDDPIMSLVPSSPAVNEMLERMRAEKAAARAAVEAAKVEWEAEMLLALEEFRDTGGFSEFYKSVVSFFESLDTNDYGTPKKSFKELLARYYQSMKIHYAFQQRDGAADIRSVFMADKMAIETMLYYGFEDIVFEGPRAALRHAMMKIVRNEVLAPLQEEKRVEEEKGSCLP